MTVFLSELTSNTAQVATMVPVLASNWLPTPPGQNYNLTFRLYGPAERVVSGSYFPPPQVQKN